MHPFRLALRQLTQSPGFTLLALLTLGLGIGVNTSMFSILDALLFRSGPFPTPDRIVQVTATTPGGKLGAFSAQELRELAGGSAGFAAATPYGHTQFALSEPGRPAERLSAGVTTEHFFETFGVRPMLGRPFTAEECQPGRNTVVVLSHSAWKARFGGREDILGQTLRLDGQTVTVIGVMPPSFDYRPLFLGAQLWRPLNYTRDQLEWRDYRVFSLFARLAGGETAASAALRLRTVADLQQQAHPELYGGLHYVVTPLREALTDPLNRRIAWMLFGLAVFVLLIACANLANLQLARATTRAREYAIRAALGASRRRLLAQQLLESVLLALAGGGLGLLLAWVTNRAVERSFVVAGAPGLSVTLDPTILGLTLAISLLTGILFGLVPAWIGSRADVNSALKQQSRGSTASRGHHRLRHGLIVLEVALATILLGGAAVMHRGFAAFLHQETGWDTHAIATTTLPVPETRISEDAKRVEFYRALEERLKSLPGVEKAAIATSLPVEGYNGARQILLDGQSPSSAAVAPTAFHVMVTADYFETLGIGLLEGRRFDASLQADSPRVVLVNASLARQLWPGRSPVGQRLGSIDSGKVYWAEVIGVVEDVEAAGAHSHPSTRFHVYKPLIFEPWSYVHLVVRSTAPGSVGPLLPRAVAAIDPELPVTPGYTVAEIVDFQQRNLHLAARVLTGFALLGLVLAAVGIFGVISNVVAQRRGEFGVRLALGAVPRDILALVLRQGMTMTAAGLAFGLVGAWGLSRFLGRLMPRLVEPDLLALGLVAVLLGLAAAIACFLPARRATRADPLEALRQE